MNEFLVSAFLAASLAAPAGPASEAPVLASAVPSAGAPEEQAVRSFRSGAASTLPVISRPTYVAYPYGYAAPVLKCAPLRACLIELEPGERIEKSILGDSERWTVNVSHGTATVVALKPLFCRLNTNLYLLTDRRIYELQLASPSCNDEDLHSETFNPRLESSRTVRFYYPDDLVRRWTSEEALAQDRTARAASARTPLAVPLDRINFDYDWSRRGRFPWTPRAVFDDGTRTYIHLPAAARRGEAPLLFLLRDNGATDLLNYTLAGDYYVADQVFDRAALVLGSGRSRRQLVIVNHSR